MAKMIPAKPRSFSPDSLEGVMFDALEQKLPDTYYVFHSFKIVTKLENVIRESETDFVIFSPNNGILCLEAKAGHVKYSDGRWRYGSGIEMSHDGPYNQASINKYKLLNYIKSSACKDLASKCKLLHAVWFPSITSNELKKEVLPPESLFEITMTKEDVFDPLPSIERIFALEPTNNVKTTLSEKDAERLFRAVLCPSFDLLPSISFENELKKQIFHRMLSEQKCILNFLSEQKTAVIQGVAGTGKTLIAIEKARRHAEDGDKVLFLCYNKFLRDHISKSLSHDNIDCYTIDAFACRTCDTNEPNYPMLKTKLEDYYFNNNFPYMHVIIDEGQDFGQINIEENEIIELIESIIVDREDSNGTFYVFYDAMQFVQGAVIPAYLKNADCKMTLYKNCRNTENIATTSMKPIKEKKPKLIDGCIEGAVPKIFFCNNINAQQNQINRIIAEFESNGIKDIVILTCKTEQSSVLTNYIYDGKYKRKYTFTTCRKFKGLEADAIIVVDIDKNVLTTEASRIFYVGASRARLFLNLVCDLSREDSKDILDKYGKKSNVKNPMRALATELNTIYTWVEE